MNTKRIKPHIPTENKNPGKLCTVRAHTNSSDNSRAITHKVACKNTSAKCRSRTKNRPENSKNAPTAQTNEAVRNSVSPASSSMLLKRHMRKCKAKPRGVTNRKWLAQQNGPLTKTVKRTLKQDQCGSCYQEVCKRP